jgi:serine/threonine protein kinase
VQLAFAFQNAERLFFLMEVARGGNFYRMIIKQAPKPFRYERIVFHSGEIACALDFLHSKRIVNMHLHVVDKQHQSPLILFSRRIVI